MKQKLFMLLAVILLGSASAFAQSGSDTPIKGDVNGDGVVDIADIAAVIDIIKNNQGPTTYYWYVGHVSESNAMDNTYLTNLVTGENGNSTTSTTGPSTLTMPTTSGEILLYIYPTIWGTPTITYETYGTGDDTFENAGLTPPNGYNITFWNGGNVEGKTLDITWIK
jgi:hypothetical protein